MRKNRLSTLASILILSGSLGTLASAADLTASSETPTVIFYDTGTSAGAGSTPWTMVGNDNAISITDKNAKNVLQFEVPTSTANNDNSINVNSTGTVSFVNKKVSITKADTTAAVKNAPTVTISNPNNVTLGDSGSLDWFLNKDLDINDDYKNKTFNIAYDFNSVGVISKIPFTIVGNANDNSVFMNENGIGILNGNPQAAMDVKGDIKASFNGAGIESVYNLLTLSANDTDGTGPSEASFVLRNVKANKEWLFRTIDNGTAFTATLGGTGGPEFKVVSDQGDYTKTKLYIGGQLVFANGKIQAGVLP